MKIAAFIPARGGSKRLPGKNTLLFAGLPLMVHSIRQAIQNEHLISGIYVSTDDDEIAECARDAGALVIVRPDNISDDKATTVAAMRHGLSLMPSEIEALLLLQPTNPLRPDGLISQAIELFNRNESDSLFTVSPLNKKAGKISGNRFEPLNYSFGERSQDMDQLYFENGLLYITRRATIMNSMVIGTNHISMVVDHPFGSVDIDTQEDLEYAEWVFNKY